MYHGLSASKNRRMKELVAENSRLKRMVEDRRVQNVLLKDALEKEL